MRALLTTSLALGMALPIAAQRGGLRDLPLPRSTRAVQFSSRDPSGGNDDHGHYLATAADGSQVLARCSGPGRITRIWSANPTGKLRIELDGQTVWNGPFAALLDGSSPGFRSPLVGRGAGGGALSLVPLGFADSCQVLAVLDDPTALYYQIGIELGTATVVGDAEAERAALLDPGFPRDACRTSSAPAVRCETEAITLLDLAGPVEVVEIRVTPTAGIFPESLAREVWIEVLVDGDDRASIAAPLGDLFGLAFDGAGIDTLAIYGLGTTRVLRLPIPCHDRLVMRAVAVSSRAAGLTFDFEAAWRPLPPSHDRLPLRARFHRATNQTGRSFDVLHVGSGPGHYVGAYFAMAGGAGQGITFLEGDESITVDHEAEPAILGTGTEDDLNGAWYFRGGTFRAPWHAVATLDTIAGRVAAARFRGADAVPFTTALDVRAEHGGENDAPGSDYAALAFWYGGPAPEPIDAATRRAWTRPQRAPHPIRVGVADGRLRIDPGDPAHACLLGSEVLLLQPGQRPRVLRFDRDARVDATDGSTVELQPWLDAIRTFRIVGPFGVPAPRAGIDTLFGPESDADPKRSYADVLGAGSHSWFDAPSPGDWTGYVDLDALVQPRDAVVCYAACVVESPTAQDAVLILGSDDAVKAWLDGALVHRHVGVRGSGRDQDRVPVRLHAGAQTLLLKIEDYAGGFGFHARLDVATPVTTRAR